MCTELQIALLGILGTLGGTVLGWFLNTLSQKGKLNIYVSSWCDKFQYNDESGFKRPSLSIGQTESYVYHLSLDLYNNSGTTKIMRNIEIVFAADKTELSRSVPKDDATRRYSGPANFYDAVEPINIPPKTVLKIDLHEGYWKDSLNFIWKVDRVFLRYTDGKNKTRTLPIKKEIYKDYFINHKTEEQNNGQA